MVIIGLPEVKSQEFWEKVQVQRLRVNQLMRQGFIQSYSLSDDLNTLWINMTGKDEWEIKNKIGSFPLIKYMSVKIVQLRFIENSVLKSPYLFLN